MGTHSKSATYLATENVNLVPFKRGELRCKFLARKSANSSPIRRCKFLARKSAKLIANFSATEVMSLPSLSLSVSLSLSLSLSLYLSLSLSLSLSLTPSAPHAQYRKRFALPIIISILHFFFFWSCPDPITYAYVSNEMSIISGRMKHFLWPPPKTLS